MTLMRFSKWGRSENAHPDLLKERCYRKPPNCGKTATFSFLEKTKAKC